jgi:hypothetical protein
VVLVADSDVEFFRPFNAEMFVRNSTVRSFCEPKSDRQAAAAPHDLAPSGPRTAGVAAGRATVCGLHLVASCLGPNDCEADIGVGFAHYGAPLADRDCRAAPLLRVRALRRVRRLCDRRAGQLVRFGRLALPALLEATPLNLDSAAHFIRGVRPTDIAAVIQSKSRTPLAVREAAFAALRGELLEKGFDFAERHHNRVKVRRVLRRYRTIAPAASIASAYHAVAETKRRLHS